MKNVATELYRAVVAVKQGKESLGLSAKATGPSESLDIAFTGRSRHLLRVLSETFAQSESDFASTLLNHGLSETLKILPDVLSDEEFARVEERIIAEIGLSAYLSLQPVIPYEKGLPLPNFAEVSTRKGVTFGKWVKSEDSVLVCDIHTQEVLFTFGIADRPEMSVDGITWQWKGSNVKPLFGVSAQAECLVDALEEADILIVGSEGYLYKEDEYSGDLVFASFSNFAEHALAKDEEFKKLFHVTEKAGSVSIEPTSSAMSTAEKTDNGSWICGIYTLQALTVNNVIISPEE